MQADHSLSQTDVELLLGGERVIRAQTKERKVTMIERMFYVLIWLPVAFLVVSVVVLFVPELVKRYESRSRREAIGPVT